MTLSESYHRLRKDLEAIYDLRESASIADLVLTFTTGMDKGARLVHAHRTLEDQLEETLAALHKELLAGRPVQYVIGEAWFSGMPFFVDERVLIPRPETDELVEWASKVWGTRSSGAPRILDIGTGSGCIAIALKKKLPMAWIMAIDKSTGALEVAMQNAKTNLADIEFRQIDFLEPVSRGTLPIFDLIISNPPYIPTKDKKGMSVNVIEHEPHMALFVENEDPLVFYRSIVDFGKTNLSSGGMIFCEIHEEMGSETVALFGSMRHQHVELKSDMQGKERMLGMF